MKKYIIAILITLFSSTAIMAQERERKFNPEEFKANLECFITKEACLTPAEAQAIFPIFHEMKEKQRALQHRIFRLRKECPCNASDEEYNKIIQEKINLDKQKNQLEETYYKKMCKVASPKKVYQTMLADDKFHRQVLDKINKDKNKR